ncbi:MAG: hypothetical protein FWF67_01930 [Fibromonadales bacterium]|nr:hypothetical protein [Fibromonadales bacterium]
MVLKFLLFTAIFLLASCVAIERNNPDDPGSPNYGTGGYGSGLVTITPGPSVTYEGETYKTVVIGTQTWFQRNLNYAVEGSKCYNNDKSYCDTYGRLYDWAAAMDLPENCNYYLSCTSQVSEKHKGVCPNGWHIPSNADWNTLMKSINPRCSDNSDCINAGTKLKSVVSWDTTFSALYPKGTDDYGFSALPSGSGGYSDGLAGGSSRDTTFSDVGKYGGWWSTSENSSYNFYAYYRYVSYYTADAVWHYHTKSTLDGVRCVKDSN